MASDQLCGVSFLPAIATGEFTLADPGPRVQPTLTGCKLSDGACHAGDAPEPEAEKYFEKTIEVDASFANAYYQLGTLLQKRGENARAAMLLDRFKVLTEKTEQPTVPIPSR